MKSQLLLISLLFQVLLISSFIYAQDDNTNQSSCGCTECRQFDFWIGEWNAEWLNQDSTIVKGSNVVKSILNGCVIEENFDGYPGVSFRGKSFSVYNTKSNLWQQTWVDDSGGYMIFIGAMDGDKMKLSRQVEFKGKELTQRMVFQNIKDDSFDWSWESSTDGGENWIVNWEIHYTRK